MYSLSMDTVGGTTCLYDLRSTLGLHVWMQDEIEKRPAYRRTCRLGAREEHVDYRLEEVLVCNGRVEV